MSKNYKEAFSKTRLAGSIAAGALDEVAKIIKPGIRTEEIDKLCYEFINDHKAFSAPLFYRGFPKSCCTSTNHVVCHGIPSEKELKEGDIIGIVGNQPGLLIIHTGFITEGRDGTKRYLHASSHHERVVLTPDDIEDYVFRERKRRGIVVARPLAP